jgi:tetratricopeptide (TPR) repeat protein
MFGREGELATLLSLSQQIATRRRGGWAYIHGEPGIGKSRLTAELFTQLRAEGWQELIASCQMHTRNTPFSAWREPLRRVAGISTSLEPEAAWKKLRSAVEAADPELAPFVSVLSELMGLPSMHDREISFIEPKERRRYLTSIVMELVNKAAGDHPQLLLFEDAHWADAPSLELLASVLSRQDGRLLAVVTSRDPRAPDPLTASGAPTSIHVRELPREAARGLAASVSGLRDADIDRIVTRAQGNPLFLQEISRIGVVSAEALPETVNDMILVRLDRLQPEQKTVLRLASVIGPTFSLEALHALVGESLSSLDLERVLVELGTLGFTREGAMDLHSYAFAHILTREVAYETLPFAQRRTLHRHFAQHIEQRDGATPESGCELLLYHYELAGEPAKIVRYAAMSGDRAAAVLAIKEAMDYYRRSLSAITDSGKQLPSDRSFLIERLGDCFETTGQHGEAAKTFSEALKEWQIAPRRPRFVITNSGLRAREAALCRKIAVSFERSSGYDESLRWLDDAFAALPGRSGRVGAQIYASKSLALFRKGQYEQAVHWGRTGLGLSRRSGDRQQLAYAHHILASSYMEMGKLQKALHHDRLAVHLYHDLGDVPGQARANGNLGLSYQMTGTMDAALYHYAVALKADERTGNTGRAAIVRNNIGEVLMVMGRLDEAVSNLEAVADAYRNDSVRREVVGLAEVNLSRCWLRRADLKEAERHLRRGVRLLRQVGAQGLLTEALLQRVELRLAAGQARQARRECGRVLRTSRELKTAPLEVRAERLLGRAEAALGDPVRARSHLRASAVLARKAEASYEEALTLMELARVLQVSVLTRSQATRLLKRSIAILSRMGAALDLAEAQMLLDGPLAASPA